MDLLSPRAAAAAAAAAATAVAAVTEWQVDVFKGLIIPFGSPPPAFASTAPHLSSCHRSPLGDLVRDTPQALSGEPSVASICQGDDKFLPS